MIFAAIAAAIAVVVAVAALIFALTLNESNSKGNVPTLGGLPPTDVRLADLGSSVTLTWRDPADGHATFMITGGHPGDLLKAMGQTGPGETSYELQGLAPRLDYCFAVVAVYSASSFASSPQVCTRRVRPSQTQ